MMILNRKPNPPGLRAARGCLGLIAWLGMFRNTFFSKEQISRKQLRKPPRTGRLKQTYIAEQNRNWEEIGFKGKLTDQRRGKKPMRHSNESRMIGNENQKEGKRKVLQKTKLQVSCKRDN
jgi:hypothetical protein